jgi:hypothetical protein
VKGKPWTPKQEKELRRLVRVKEGLDVVAIKLDKSPEAIRKKIKKLGLEVVDHKKNSRTTTSLKIPEELPTVEETLKMLAGALQAAMLPRLRRLCESQSRRIRLLRTVRRISNMTMMTCEGNMRKSFGFPVFVVVTW